jgi:hypothetical protein
MFLELIVSALEILDVFKVNTLTSVKLIDPEIEMLDVFKVPTFIYVELIVSAFVMLDVFMFPALNESTDIIFPSHVIEVLVLIVLKLIEYGEIVVVIELFAIVMLEEFIKLYVVGVPNKLNVS